MSYQLWSQDIFSKGELSPFMYARATVNEYGNGLKTAQNVLTYPTGAAGKRFGTLFQTILQDTITSYNQIYFQTFQYANECTYQLVFSPLNIDIYLEGTYVANVTTTFDAQSVYNLSSTVIGTIFRVTGANFAPYDLIRSDNGILISSYTATTIVVGTSIYSVGVIYPVQFSVTGGTLFTSTPPLKVGVTYFAKALNTTTAEIYLTPNDAKFGLNKVTNIAVGTGTGTLIVRNLWAFTNTVFKNLPFYDFNGVVTSYDSINFTPNALTGNAVVNLDAPYAPLDTSYIGGAFFGGGGSSRIINVISTSQFHVAIQTPFASLNAINGSLAVLAEPAWSATRGWPQICSSYQNRALFANTVSLQNGFWASVINDYTDFGDLTTDDDDAISWFPTSNDINFIRFIVPYRSITVHTNSGIYSSPLSDIAAITPTNFTLQLQDSTPADVLQPQAIDNQILVLSGNDAHQMLWDGINNAYTSDIVSVISEQVIRDPVDETAFADLRRAGSRYVFIINANGTMAVFQTLISQNVSGFTPQIMEQSYGSAQFLQAASNSDGRCWFVCQRQIASAQSPIAISGYTLYVSGPPIVLSTLKATASNLSTTTPTAITFTTTGTLPASSPQIAVQTYYWAIGTDADDFQVYLNQSDALAGVNSINFTSAGSSSKLVAWPLTTIFTLEELTQDVHLDCAVYYNGTSVDVITTGSLFNAQSVKMVGDGFGFDAIGVNNQVSFEAHGVATDVSEAYIGFPIVTIMEPMPLSMANGPSAKQSTLTKPKHIRTVNFMFNNTIGGTINGVNIALEPFDMAHIGDPPFPARGIFSMSVMKGWDDFNNPTYSIYHDEPFDIQLLGVFYALDI